MIEYVDQILQRVITDQVRLGGAEKLEPDQVVLSTPKEIGETTDGKSRIFLFLHDIRENLALRDGTYQVMRRPDKDDALVRRAPVHLDLAYILGCVSNRPSAGHRLLSAAIAGLYRSQSIPRKYFNEEMKQEGIKEIHVSVAQADHAANERLRETWTSLGGPPVPIVGVIVTTTINPYDPTYVRLVREAVLGIGQGVDETSRPQNVRRRSVSVAGTVRNRSDDEPIEGALVKDSVGLAEALTDRMGVFHLENLPEGERKLVITAPGFQKWEEMVDIPAPGAWDPTKSEGFFLESLSSGVDRQKPGAVRVSGVIKYQNGEPAKYVVLRRGKVETVTDEYGRYEMASESPALEDLVIELPTEPRLSGNSSGTLEISPPLATSFSRSHAQSFTKEIIFGLFLEIASSKKLQSLYNAKAQERVGDEEKFYA